MRAKNAALIVSCTKGIVVPSLVLMVMSLSVQYLRLIVKPFNLGDGVIKFKLL